MRVTVLFFGATKDAAGASSVELELPSGATSADAVAAVIESRPQLGGRSLLHSVNQEYGSGKEQLREGDELAVFTAVSGG